MLFPLRTGDGHTQIAGVGDKKNAERLAGYVFEFDDQNRKLILISFQFRIKIATTLISMENMFQC